MPEVVIGRCHGGWEKSDGFAEVPPDTYLYLYNSGLHAMDAEVADGMLLGSAQAVVDLRAQATEVIEPGTGIFNFTTSDLSSDDLVWEGPVDQGIELIQGGYSLQQIFDAYPGNAIYWFACTSRVHAPQWDQDAVDARNQQNLKELPDGETTGFVQISNWVMIGDGHDWDSVQRIGAYDPVLDGQVRIAKGGLFGAGSLHVTGSPDQQGFVEAVSRVTDKSIEFE